MTFQCQNNSDLGKICQLFTFRIVEHITAGKINKQSISAVFLDIEKAFDKIWINGLIHKLITKNFHPPLSS